MYLSIGGKDRSADVGAELTARAARRPQSPARWSSADSALSLKRALNREDFIARYVGLLKLRYALSTEPFPAPARPGFAGALMRRIKGVLWKLLRYQHDHMAAQQNSLNELVINALEFQRHSFQARIEGLEQRLRELEGHQPPPPPEPER